MYQHYESIECMKPIPAVDAYAFGCITQELYNGSYVWPLKTSLAEMVRILMAGKFPEYSDDLPEFVKLILKGVYTTSDVRISFADIVNILNNKTM